MLEKSDVLEGFGNAASGNLVCGKFMDVFPLEIYRS